jgi:hypothetical protein
VVGVLMEVRWPVCESTTEPAEVLGYQNLDVTNH